MEKIEAEIEKNYKTPFLIKRKRPKKLKIFLIILFACVTFSILLSSVIRIFYILTKGQETFDYSCYAVMANSGQTKREDAMKQAQTFKTRGGAGVLFFDETFFIVLSCYEKKTDAEKIKDELKTEEREIVVKKFLVKIPKMAKENKKYIDFELKILKTLYNLSNALDKSEISDIKANQELRNILSETNALFLEVFQRGEDFFVSKNWMLNTKSILEYATSINVMQTSLLPYSSTIRQAQIQILFVLCGIS